MAFSTPGPLSARAAARDASRRRLLSAAATVFAKKGFTAAKPSDIAGRAGVAVGTLYLHFGSKEGIARAVALEALAELRAKLRQAVERSGVDAEAAAHAHAAALVDFIAGRSAVGRLLFANDSPGLRTEILDAMAKAQEAHLRERGREGYFRTDIDPAVAAQALVGMQSRVLTWWMEDRQRASRKAVVDTLARIRLSGVHAPAVAAKPASAKQTSARRGSAGARRETVARRKRS